MRPIGTLTRAESLGVRPMGALTRGESLGVRPIGMPTREEPRMAMRVWAREVLSGEGRVGAPMRAASGVEGGPLW